MTPKRPTPFTLLPLDLTVAGVAAIMSGLAVYAVASVGVGGLPVALPAVVGWALYVWLVKLRRDFIAKYPQMTKHGIMVDVGAATGRWSLQDIEDEIDRSVAMTARALGKSESNMHEVLASKHVWLRFMPGRIQHPQDRKVTVAGFVTYGGQFMRVGVETSMDTIDRSALAHEVGHVLLGRHWSDWDQTKHHEFMAKNGLYRKG